MGQTDLTLLHVGHTVVAGALTPTLNQFLGKNGLDSGRGAATTGIDKNLFSLDPTGWPHGVTSGSLVIISGTWPDNPTTVAGYPATCASPCAPTWTDNGTGNTWNAVFTPGNCKDTRGNGFDHGIYYAANYSPVASGAVQITETHGHMISDTYWSPSNWYNMATAGALDGSGTCAQVTPVNNTAPNISGTALSTTADGDLIYIEVDDSTQIGAVNTGGNQWTSITVPVGCTLLGEDIYIGHAELYCIQATHGSFTPQFTISQTTHDTFTIYAAAFKSGSGGSAPSAGGAVLLSSSAMTAQAATYTTNVGCPTTTKTLAMTDDSSSISAVSDSNSDTFTHVTNGGGASSIWYATNITVSNANTFTATVTTGGANVDLLTFYCLNTTALDTGFTAGTGNIQTTTSSVFNSITTSAGGGVSTYTNLPTGTPGVAGDVFIIFGSAGNGPFLTCAQPTGCVMDYPLPSTIAACSSTTGGVCGGDADDYNNGDIGGHFWQNSTTQINFGFTIQNNSSADSVTVTAFKP